MADVIAFQPEANFFSRMATPKRRTITTMKGNTTTTVEYHAVPSSLPLIEEDKLAQDLSVLALEEDNNTSSGDDTLVEACSDLPFRVGLDASSKAESRPKSSFRQRFWAKSGANDFGQDDDAVDPHTVVERKIYIPTHAASDSISLSSGSHSSAGRSPRLSVSSQKLIDDSDFTTSPTSSQFSSASSPRFTTTHPKAFEPLPPTPRDFQLFAAQAQAHDRDNRAAAAWGAMLQLQRSQKAEDLASRKRYSVDNVISPTSARSQTRRRSAFSEGCVSVRRVSVAETTTVQGQHAQEMKGAGRFGQKLAAYMKPARA